jgi:threonine aldolase
MIDLRSDTVTRPSAGMRAAMAAAEVGDDVFGDDPKVLRLQEMLAARAGKEAGLFFPSGTQSNLAALMSHCERGDEYIVGQDAHTYKFEGGGAAVLGSIQPQPLQNAADGTLPLELIARAIKPIEAHFARTRLLTLENGKDGKVLPVAYVAQATHFAKSKGLATHLDGARGYNAAIALNTHLESLCAPFDSVSICLSKGLGTPAGSVLVGPKAVMERAHRWRKVLGGGMRQVGVLAAAGIYALDHNVARLAEDHENAGRLAKGLSQMAEIKVTSQATNMVFVSLPEEVCEPLAAYLKTQGILIRARPNCRLVTHLDVSARDIDAVVTAIKSFFAR